MVEKELLLHDSIEKIQGNWVWGRGCGSAKPRDGHVWIDYQASAIKRVPVGRGILIIILAKTLCLKLWKAAISNNREH